MKFLKQIVLSLTLLLLLVSATSAADQPRLVVLIALDQFPQEELMRFRPFFGKGGFELLLSRGAVFTQAQYRHAAAMTGPGHAVMLTGAYGNANGIIANTWYDRNSKKNVYCVADSATQLVGATGQGSSPRQLLTATFGDMLRVHSGFRAKVFSFSNKDRAAILMGGRFANGAFWMVDSAFVTSTYYMNQLPAWASAFNTTGLINAYFGRVWKKSLPPAAYATLGSEDDEPYEEDPDGMGHTFPHRITGKDSTRITGSYFGAVIRSPFGADLLAELARRAVAAERLGQRDVTDLLCVSFSSTDYVGHAYGPHSHEILDMVVQMDRILADFFRFLDKQVGLRNCAIALTSDHGVAPVPEFIARMAPSSGARRIARIPVADSCNAALSRHWGAPTQTKWIERITDRNVYLSESTLGQYHASPDEAARIAADVLQRLPGVAVAFTREDVVTGRPGPFLDAARRSFFPLRSGDLSYILKPFLLEGEGKGTTHGDPYSYNIHVPLVIMGKGMKAGWYDNDVSIADLAPTLSALTGVELPPVCEGKALVEAMGRAQH